MVMFMDRGYYFGDVNEKVYFSNVIKLGLHLSLQLYNLFYSCAMYFAVVLFLLQLC
jgi:hypothetical protein